MEKMQKTMGEMSKKLDSLERIPKCLANNPSEILQKRAPEASFDKALSQCKVSVESSNESDDNIVAVEESLKDKKHRLYFKNLLIKYIEREIPER
ncbi:hypothetical protein BpHYR1_053655 [Brachionus plicatilis]|uniref:Uncharacterized protein n=1 Tax=Brachionus plicatilis TaxID=10195 RepID=A0A3M7P350_BRAPC|nr:hypothetical protein BpHYR1_053655 [Brachionus plicatilis]